MSVLNPKILTINELFKCSQKCSLSCYDSFKSDDFFSSVKLAINFSFTIAGLLVTNDITFLTWFVSGWKDFVCSLRLG